MPNPSRLTLDTDFYRPRRPAPHAPSTRKPILPHEPTVTPAPAAGSEVSSSKTNDGDIDGNGGGSDSTPTQTPTSESKSSHEDPRDSNDSAPS